MRYKVEESSPGNYMVWDRQLGESLLDTQNLTDACTYCCGLRALFSEHGLKDVTEMVNFCRIKFNS